ncbi:MAG: GIY-YIG nuclease family protein [Promethearchaeota archaeon]
MGKILFEKGKYYYIGSAMGEKGSSSLINRVKRHLKPPENKKLHWHIDYFLNNKECQIIKLSLIPSAIRLECVIAKELIKRSDGFIKGFGCSDCSCKSHLIYFKNSSLFYF